MTVTWHLPTYSFDGASLSQHRVQRGPRGQCVQAGGHVTLEQTSGDVTRGLFMLIHTMYIKKKFTLNCIINYNYILSRDLVKQILSLSLNSSMHSSHKVKY